MTFGDFIVDGALDRARLKGHVQEFFSQPGAELSMNEETGDCFYRYPDDYSRRCGVGCAIGDGEYREAIEAKRAHEALGMIGYGDLPGEDMHWLDALQSLHDSAQDLAHFLGRLAAFGIEDLSVEALENILAGRV